MIKRSVDENDASNGNPYCIPGDVAILLLVSNLKDIGIKSFLLIDVK